MPEKMIFYVCNGSSCQATGLSMKVLKRLQRELQAQALANKAEARFCGCTSFCKYSQMVCVAPDGTAYSRVTENDVAPIVESHAGRGEVYAAKKIRFD